MDNTNDTNNNLSGGGNTQPPSNQASNKVSDDSQISDLQREIQAQFSGVSDDVSLDNQEDAPIQTPDQENNQENIEPNIQAPSTASNDTDFPFPSVASKRQPVADSPETSFADIENPGGMQTSLPEQPPEEEVQSSEPTEQEVIAGLQKDIESDFSNQHQTVGEPSVQAGESQPAVSDQQATTSNTKLGVGETYYSDLNKAMTANEPRTMSELIQQSAYEKKARATMSPTSKKNLMYIFGTLFFLIISVIAWLLVFGTPEKQAEFITKERVSSLVFSDQDLGINTSGLETFQTKSAIRSVVERDQSTDSVSQIYYVQQDDFGNLRRMGVKDIFERTDNEVPELLYDNIENEFMHGVYTTDKNYPFIVLKALSYDRAFEGMRQWEPTMIDDLATYFDLPPEAVDRSLRQDGFSDDLIKNKNVRVARYIPREADRRGILDFLRSDGSEFEQTDVEAELEEEENPFESFFEDIPDLDDGLAMKVLDILMFPIKTSAVYAQQTQDIGGTFISDTLNQSTGGTNVVCYRANKVCIDLTTGNQLPGSTTPSTTVACYDSIFDPSNPDDIGETFTPEQVQGQPGFICREVLSGGASVSTQQEIDTLYTDLVCFDRFSGKRLPPAPDGMSYQQSNNAVCFTPYSCRRVACFRNGREVSSSEEGQPGVSCRATNDLVSPEANVRKSCTQFHELLSLEQINNLNLCFDQTGRFVPVDSRVQSLEDYYTNYAASSQQSVEQVLATGGGLQCISAQSRYKRLCLTTNGEVVPGMTRVNGVDVPVSTNNPNIEFCFEPFQSTDLSNEFNRNLNTDMRQQLAAIAQQLRTLAILASGFGIFPNDVSETLNEAADALWEISVMNLLEYEVVMKVAEVTRTLELLLNAIDPGAPNSEVTRQLREIIEFIKSVLGLNNNVAWVTIGNKLPQGVDIYPNGEVSGGSLTTDQRTEAIEAVQQSLVLLGLMDPLSVTGNLDLVTQQALQLFQQVNGFIDGNEDLSVDQIFISAEMLRLIQQMVEGSDTLFGGSQSVTIDDYFSGTLGLGQYSAQVQQLQVVLYALGYDISAFNGIFDEEVCSAVQRYQMDNGLEVVDAQECILSLQTINSLNEAIRQNNYLGSGFAVNSNGALEGNGEFLGTFGPGTVNYEVSEAEAASLREGDVVLMYTFLDEETILITRHESVITEVIRRRALSDIFNR